MRLPNWPQLMADELQRWLTAEFNWGATDCCQFVRRMTEVLTGEDLGAKFPEYESEFGAARVIAEHGGMEGLLIAAFGESKHPAFAKRGDVVMADFGRGLQPSICLGVDCVAPGERGLVTRPTLSGVAAWSIG